MGRADQRNGAGAMCSMEMKRLSAIKIITQECLLGRGEENRQTKTSSDSVEATYFSLLEGNGWNLPGCAEAASPFKGLIPAQSWSWAGLLGLLSLEGKGNWGQAYKAY